MKSEQVRVLVIDDDEVVLVAISDLLEEHGYEVYTQASPIGATQLILRERIDVAIVDVNLPTIQGDNVVRLLRTWDRLKDLPVLMISGAEPARLEQLRRELPGIQLIAKSRMNQDLVRALQSALASASRASIPKRSLAPFADTHPSASRQDAELIELFLAQLSDASQLAHSVWREVDAGNTSRVSLLSSSLNALISRAQLLSLAKVTQLLQALQDVLSLVRPGKRPSERTRQSVGDAIIALGSLRRTGTGTFTTSPDFLINNLQKASAELRAAS